MIKQNVYIINYGMGNLRSVENALKKLNCNCKIINDPNELDDSDKIILPGVGSFKQGMAYLVNQGLVELIRCHANSGGKVIGICLGLQLLFNSSDESPGVCGLNILDGQVVKIPDSDFFHVPHIGWNALSATCNTPPFMLPIFNDSGLSESDYYFVHSYYALPHSNCSSIASVHHPSGALDVAFRVDNVYAFQFHPEKSGPAGYNLLNMVITQ